MTKLLPTPTQDVRKSPSPIPTTLSDLKYPIQLGILISSSMAGKQQTKLTSGYAYTTQEHQGDGIGDRAAQDWLIYSDEHQLLICAFHGYAVRNLEGYLRDRHPDINHRARSILVRRHEGLGLYRPLEERLASHSPSNPTAAVEGLPIRQGFTYTLTHCGYLTPSWKCLQAHFNGEHGIKGARAQANHWVDVHLQTFFTGPKRAIRYFCITVPEGNEGRTAPAAEKPSGEGKE